MTDSNPAIPAKAAIPGAGEPGKVPAPAAAANATPDEGKVTITTKEYAELNRNAARLKSFQNRAQFAPKPAANPSANPDDPINQEIDSLRSRATTAETALQRERMTNKVRDLLARPEYAKLPESTRKLILKNPSALSQADNADEALMDVEDFVREEVAGLSGSSQPGPASKGPDGHETPPRVSAGASAPADNTSMEDVSELTGPARSRAIMRNAAKRKALGIK